MSWATPGWGRMASNVPNEPINPRSILSRQASMVSQQAYQSPAPLQQNQSEGNGGEQPHFYKRNNE